MIMHRFHCAALATVAVLGFTSVASAADMPVKAPAPIVAPLYNWTGPYVGIAGGYGWGHSNQTDPAIIITGNGSYSLTGGILGGTLGYNWQQGPWVFGVEGDYSWADISGSSNTCGFPFVIHSCGSKIESLGTLRGRIGYAMGATGNWLPYVTGGLAVGEVNAWDSLLSQSGSAFRAGWTVGGGVETGITQNWRFKVEYLYVDLGSQQMFNIVPGVPETVSFTANIIRAGINYSF
jgi:outer membrane immunogenic protein